MSHGKKRQKLLVDEKGRCNLGCHGIIKCREFSNLFLTGSTSPKLHRLGVQKKVLLVHRIITDIYFYELWCTCFEEEKESENDYSYTHLRYHKLRRCSSDRIIPFFFLEC